MRKLKAYSISTISISCFLLIWHFGTKWSGVPNYLLPGPIEVAKSAWVLYSTGLIFPHIGITVAQMLLGYFFGCIIAFLLGALVAEFALAERIVFPYVVGFQSMPKVALAPLLLVWFGFGMTFKVVLVALICFFPMFINTMTGLRSANPDLVDLYRAFSAPRWLIFWDVKLPSAANSIFAGLQISIVLGLIGTVVGEFLAARQGLGHLIQSSSMNFDVGAMFTSVFTLSLIGVSANFVVRWIYRKVVYWEKATLTAPASGH